MRVWWAATFPRSGESLYFYNEKELQPPIPDEFKAYEIILGEGDVYFYEPRHITLDEIEILPVFRPDARPNHTAVRITWREIPRPDLAEILLREAVLNGTAKRRYP